MRRHHRILIIAAVAASLLDPTFGEVVVQPGYSNPSKTAEVPSAKAKQDASPSQIQQPQESYVGSSQPAWDNAYRERWRQQQLYQQQLQRQRQQYLEDYQRYQQQQQLYRQSQMQQYMLGQPQRQEPVVGSPQQKGDNEMVGSTMMLPMIHPFAAGKGWGGRTFALGPLGLYSQSLGGHGGLGGVGGLGGAGYRPLLLAPNPQSEQTASDQKPNPVAETATSRGGRKARDIGESGGQRFRHKSAVHERNGLASDSAVASSKQTRNAPSLEKMKDDTVGDAVKQIVDETVGAPFNLDPLGLAKKAEDLIGGLSFLPPPSHNSHHSFPGNDSPWSRDRPSYGYDDFDDTFVGSARDQDSKQNAPGSGGQKQNVERHRGNIVDDRRGLYYPEPPPRGFAQPVYQYGMYPSHGVPSSYRPGWVRSPVSMPSGGPLGQSSLAPGKPTEQTAQPTSVIPQFAGLPTTRQDQLQFWGYGTDPGSFSPFGTFERTDLAPMIHEAPLGMRLTDGTSFYRVISAPTSIDSGDWSQQLGNLQPAATPAAVNPAPGPQIQEPVRVTETMDSSFANWPAQMMGFPPMSGGSNPFGSGMESMIWAKSAQQGNNYGRYQAQPTPMLGRPSPDVVFNENRDTTYIRDDFGVIPTRHRDIYDDRPMQMGYGGIRPVRVHEHHESRIY